MQNKKKLELLAPAGDLEKLKIAVLYGADAVYIGGEAYGLRAKAKNFDIDTMAEGVRFAHEHGVKVYVTANIFAHNMDFEGMAEYFKAVESIGVDALIISDLGVFSVAKEAVPNIEIQITDLRPIRSPIGPPTNVPAAVATKNTNRKIWECCTLTPNFSIR